MTLTEFLSARLDDYERAIEEVTSSYFDAPMSEAEMWADLEAKRRIVDLAQSFIPTEGSMAEATLIYLAAVYADHEDYRDEWRPY